MFLTVACTTIFAAESTACFFAFFPSVPYLHSKGILPCLGSDRAKKAAAARTWNRNTAVTYAVCNVNTRTNERTASTCSIDTPRTLSPDQLNRTFYIPASPRRDVCCIDLAPAHGPRFLLSLRQHPWETCTALREPQEARGKWFMRRGSNVIKYLSIKTIFDNTPRATLRHRSCSSPAETRGAAMPRASRSPRSPRSG